MADLRLTVLVCLSLSGCCCDVPGLGGSTLTWDDDVKRAQRNADTMALQPGTANVFTLEVQQPVGLTQEQQDARDAQLERLEAAKLELKLAELRSETARFDELRQALAAVEAEPQPRFGSFETITRYRFVVVHPYSTLFDSAGFMNDGCASCINEANRNGVYMYSPGHVQLQLGAVTNAQLVAGLDVHGSFSIGSVGEANTRSIWIPSTGKGVVKLVQSCPAEVAYVTKSVNVGNGGGVIAVPRHEDRSWFELRGASCATPAGIVEEQVSKSTVTPNSKTSELGFRIMQLRAMIDRGGR